MLLDYVRIVRPIYHLLIGNQPKVDQENNKRIEQYNAEWSLALIHIN